MKYFIFIAVLLLGALEATLGQDAVPYEMRPAPAELEDPADPDSKIPHPCYLQFKKANKPWPPVCPDGMVFDWEICECVCENQEGVCPCWQIWNPVTCSCDCQFPKSCKPGFVWSKSACACVCPKPTKQCPCFSVWDNSKCLCVKKISIKCASPFVIDYNACDCICPEPTKPCPCHHVWNQKKCLCECKQDVFPCNDPKYWNNTVCGCICKNITICKPTEIWDSDKCKCVCILKSCVNPKHFVNPNTCQCECKRILKCTPKVWDKNLCECVCDPRKRKACILKGYYFDDQTCICYPCENRNILFKQCQIIKGTWSDSECKCLCNEFDVKECEARGGFWLHDSCECICHPDKKADCEGQGHFYDEKACICYPCKNRNELLKLCLAKGGTWSDPQCRCLCNQDDIKKCLVAGYSYNYDTCICNSDPCAGHEVEMKNCLAKGYPFTWNQDLCSCECDKDHSNEIYLIKCAPRKMAYDASTCTCVPCNTAKIPWCPEPLYWSPRSCSCVGDMSDNGETTVGPVIIDDPLPPAEAEAAKKAAPEAA